MMSLQLLSLTLILSSILSGVYHPTSSEQVLKEKGAMHSQNDDREIKKIIEYFRKHGIEFKLVSLYEGKSQRWVLAKPAEKAGKLILSFKVYPLTQSKESIEKDLMMISLPFILNDRVNIAMAYPWGAYINEEGKEELRERIIELFMNYGKD